MDHISDENDGNPLEVDVNECWDPNMEAAVLKSASYIDFIHVEYEQVNLTVVCRDPVLAVLSTSGTGYYTKKQLEWHSLLKPFYDSIVE